MLMDYFESTTISELEKVIDKEKNLATRNKFLVIWHKKKGKTEEEIQSILRVPRSTVGYLVRQFRKSGIKAFQKKSGYGGYNRYLSKEQEKQLRGKLKRDPMTTKEALAYISNEFGKQYHPNSIQRLLKRLGQSLITPRPRHYEANPRSESAFRGHIKKVKFVEI